MIEKILLWIFIGLLFLGDIAVLYFFETSFFSKAAAKGDFNFQCFGRIAVASAFFIAAFVEFKSRSKNS